MDGLSIKEAARQLGVSTKTIQRRIEDGTIKAEKVLGPYGLQYCIPRVELDRPTASQPIVPLARGMNPHEVKELMRNVFSDVTEEIKRDVLAGVIEQNDLNRKFMENITNSLEQRILEKMIEIRNLCTEIKFLESKNLRLESENAQLQMDLKAARNELREIKNRGFLGRCFNLKP